MVLPPESVHFGYKKSPAPNSWGETCDPAVPPGSAKHNSFALLAADNGAGRHALNRERLFGARSKTVIQILFAAPAFSRRRALSAAKH
jgi:hypothetical protein